MSIPQRRDFFFHNEQPQIIAVSESYRLVALPISSTQKKELVTLTLEIEEQDAMGKPTWQKVESLSVCRSSLGFSRLMLAMLLLPRQE